MMVGVAYFLVWAAVGAVIFPFGVALAEMEMRHTTLAEIAPFAIGVVVVIAGALQFSPWKTRQLVYCREGHCGCRALRADARTAFRHGLRIGLHCCYCCANLTAILLVIGVMDLRAMAVVTAAITLERLAAAGERSARVIGAVIVAAGIFVTTKAVGLG